MNESARAAVVGLAKAGPQSEPDGELAFAARETDTPETRFLLSVAAENLRTEVGRLPSPAPERPPCDEEPAVALSGEVARLAATVCDTDEATGSLGVTERERLLKELCERLVAHGRTLPAAVVPAALDAASGAGGRSTRLRPAVAAAAGARGRWLSPFNPAWDWVREFAAGPAALAEDDFAEAFSGDPFSVRRRALARWRAADPAAARAALEETWKGETAFRRASLLETFAEGLSAADEPFLEAALADRSKAVAAAAQELLLARPESAYAAARRTAADRLLNVGGRLKAKLTVTLPPAGGEPLEGDGGFDWGALSTASKPEDAPRGARAERLVQALGGVPLRHWTERFERTPAQLIALADGAEHGGDVIAGWLLAGARFASIDPSVAREWAPALAKRSTARLDALKKKQNARRETLAAKAGIDDLAAFAAALPPSDAAAFVTPLLAAKAIANDPAEWGPTLWTAVPDPWPDEFARAVLAAVEDGRNKQGREGGYEYHRWHTALPGVLERLPPAVLAELSPGWPTTDGDPPQWLENAAAAAQLRRRMHELLP